MFEFTGKTSSGEDVEQKVVSADEILKTFNLKLPKGQIRFELLDSVKSKKGGTVVFASQRNIQPLYNGVWNGNSYVIRYSATRNWRPGSNHRPGEWVYGTKRLRFVGRSMNMDTTQKKEEALAFLLSPLCQQSPFANGQSHYRVVDIEEQAKQQLAAMAMIDNFKQEVFSEKDEDKIIRIALGLRVRGRTIPVANAKTADTAKLEILLLAQKHPTEVHSQYHSFDTGVLGITRQAESKGLIMVRELGNGNRAWTWADGNEIIRIGKGEDKYSPMIDFLSDKENMFRMAAKMNKGVSDTSIVDEAIERGILGLTEAGVVLFNEDGEAKRTLIKEPTENWKEELSNNPRILGHVKNAL